VKASSVAAPPARLAVISSRASAVSSRPSRPRPYDEAEARRLLNEGNQKLLSQDPSGAVALFQQALTLKPGNPTLAAIPQHGHRLHPPRNIEEGAHYYRLYLPLCTNPAEKAQLQKVLDDYEARRR